jgi:phosphotransferase system enzyme I (PtsP)
VSLKIGEGITGHAAQSNGPVVIQDALSDGRFKYFSITGEEKYRGMISCPIRDGERLLGVLNIQTVKKRLFNDFEINYVKIVSNLIRNCLKIRSKKR